MSYLDALTDPSFKRQPDGSTAFYPYGVLGRGYVLPDPTFESDLRRDLKVSYVVVLVFTVISLVVARRQSIQAAVFAAIVLLLLYALWFEFRVRRRVRGLPPAVSNMKWSDATEAQARALGWLWVACLALISAFFTGVGLWKLFTDPTRWFAAGFVILFSFACFVSIGSVAWRKGRNRPRDGA